MTLYLRVRLCDFRSRARLSVLFRLVDDQSLLRGIIPLVQAALRKAALAVRPQFLITGSVDLGEDEFSFLRSERTNTSLGNVLSATVRPE